MRNRLGVFTQWGLATCLVAAMCSASAWAEGPKRPPEGAVTAATVDSRMANVRRLVFTSSGAKRVQDSGKAAAIGAREKAMSSFQAAERAREGGDLQKANELLEETTAHMFTAIRTAGTGAAGLAKKENDFGARAESVDVLTNALKRIASEKKATSDVAGSLEAVNKHRAKAEKLHAAGNIDGARAELDMAYEQAKVAIERLRRGDTLVRDLKFASKAEEYDYELDRNETHRMLCTLLLEEKSQQVRAMADKYIGEAQQLRKQAEGQAARKEFGRAVKTLEESTKAYVRAIRGAGVYIPG